MNRAEDIPEYGNIAQIEKSHWRELDRDWEVLNPAVHAFIHWLRYADVKSVEQAVDEFKLNHDQRELLDMLVNRQLRLSNNARCNQLSKKYGGFKTGCKRLCVPPASFEHWQEIGMPSPADYAERKMNGEPMDAPRMPSRPCR